MTELNEATRSLYERARLNDLYRRACDKCKESKAKSTEAKTSGSKE